MALLSRGEIVSSLEKLGEHAARNGFTIQLVLMGGAAMVMGYGARQSTHDIDALIIPPPDPAIVRGWIKQIAVDNHWPDDWLNDAAKGYLTTVSQGPIILSAAGIEVRQLSGEQLLAMKLIAWRDDTDISDAQILLKSLDQNNDREKIWNSIIPYLIPGRELKARYAFDDLWDHYHG